MNDVILYHIKHARAAEKFEQDMRILSLRLRLLNIALTTTDLSSRKAVFESREKGLERTLLKHVTECNFALEIKYENPQYQR